MMKRNRTVLVALLAVLCGACLAPAFSSAATIYSEGFSGSTVMSATPAAPTATSTDYAVLSSKNATGSTVLDLTIPATSGGFAEMQALFTTSPVVLQNAGDCIKLEVTFRPSFLLDISDANNETLNFGLYNSGGSYPVPGGAMANGGFGSSTNFVTGYAQNWTGYVGRMGVPSTSNDTRIYTRDPQTDTNDENQDVLFSNAGTGAYDNPSGSTVAPSTGGEIILVQGVDYTYTLEISYDGSIATVSQNLYDGVGTGGTNLMSQTGTDSSGYLTYDALAFGFRGRDTNGNALDLAISALTVSTCEIPEPASLALLALSGLALAVRRQR